MPTDLEGKLVVGSPCGLAMAYLEVRKLLKEANPKLEFVDHIKNVEPMVKELLDDKADMDVFFALGDIEMKRLEEKGVVEGETVPFLKQRMHLTVQKGNPLKIEKLEDLAKPEVKTVAVCIDGLSIGYYGRKALEAVGVWEKLKEAGKIVRPDQPAKAKQMVIDKKVDAAFTYAACANEEWQKNESAKDLSVIGKADTVLLVPEELYGGMHAVAAVTKNAKNPEAARKFLDFLLSPAAQDAFEKLGYGKAETTPEFGCSADSGDEDAPVSFG
ncbi:MAG: molybdate ABC transporter substrate-binding protein [Armatimonadetes bacterium]|nr:molybdate ABC transporter substrate-binding protein [Armatimonadota bacterium]